MRSQAQTLHDSVAVSLLGSRLGHFSFLYVKLHFSISRSREKSINDHKENRYLRVILVKVYFEFSIARLLVFALIFHITHLIIKGSR